MPILPTFTSLGSGPTILMLHGVGGGHRVFAPQVETLALAGYRAVAWDMPGYGHSAPIDPYNFKGLAHSCITLIEALEPGGSVILLGHSMGGMVAQEVVARRPDLVNTLVLCATSAGFGATDEAWSTRFIAQRLDPLDAGQSMAQLAQSLLPQVVGPAALPEGLQLAMHCMAQISPVTYRHAVQALPFFDRAADLARIHVPTLLLAGALDQTAPPRLMQRMGAAIGGSTYTELPGVGHLPQLEAPEAFDAAVLDFLASRRRMH